MGETQLIAGRYELGTIIGRGGMGDVFRGLDTQTGEPVAIKRLKPDIIEAMPSLLERFEREGQALRQLNHPNIVKMLDSVEENGLHYLVMEYVGGGSLQDLLIQEPQLPIRRALEIALDLADALTRAHRLKIIHRDIKPANVLLAEDGTPRLTDFGVAHLGTRTRMTETGSLIGTYAYLSPEACVGEDLDARTDIWSFGVMLFEMLAGQRPFEEPHEVATLHAIMNKPVPDLASLRLVPPALAELIAQMLEKDRDQRISSVRQVGAALEAMISSLDGGFVDTTPRGRAARQNLSRFATPTPDSVMPEDQGVQQVMTLPSVIPPHRRKLGWVLGGIAGALVVGIVLAVVLLAGGGKSHKTTSPGEETVAPVEPVGPGEYMVLVAQLEPLASQERDVTRFIVENLTQTLEVSVPFSDIRIREYPQVITTHAAAQAAASANGAAVVVWGNYDDTAIWLNVEIGATAAFPLIQIPYDIVERTANVQVRMTNERQESVAPQVLGVFDVLLTADGDAYEVMRTLAILDEINVVPAEIEGGGVAASLQRAMTLYLEDTTGSIQAMDTAITLDAGNPIPYVYRATANLRQGLNDKFLLDVETSQRLGPAGWTAPLYLLSFYASTSHDLDQAIAYYDQIIAQRPNDWFPWNYRGALYYLKGDYTRAKADYERALALGPNANFPYIISMMIALREGRLADAQAFLNTIFTQFPDPTLANRIVQATFGGQVPNVWGPVFSAFGNLILGQYDQVISDTETALAIDAQLSDMYMAQGLSYCILGNNAAAETAYSQGIAIDPNFTLLYVLRAEVLNKQNKTREALQDMRVIQTSGQAGDYIGLLPAFRTGALSCANFMTYDYSQVGK